MSERAMPSRAEPCDDGLNRTAAYLDGQLDRRERHRYEEHVQRCAACADLLAACLADFEAEAREQPRGAGERLLRPIWATGLTLAAAAAVFVAVGLVRPGREPREVPSTPTWRDAEVPEATVAGKRFRFVGGVWLDDAVAEEDVLLPHVVTRGSAEFDALVARHPALAEWAALGDVVVVELDGEAVEIVAEE